MELIVEVKPDGSILVYASGAQGPSCVPAVKQLSEALGVTLREEHLPEYYAENHEVERDFQHDLNRQA
ncbi:MAG: DUF2997 domain-containing protein [Chloroflexi bacterium]|nr:DUF2997 domain-containing protein [Chloroflexota bacterium]